MTDFPVSSVIALSDPIRTGSYGHTTEWNCGHSGRGRYAHGDVYLCSDCSITYKRALLEHRNREADVRRSEARYQCRLRQSDLLIKSITDLATRLSKLEERKDPASK